MTYILSFIVAFGVAVIAGQILIPVLRRLKAGQSIREDGPTWHMSKQGTPTMGGLMFILAIAVAIVAAGAEQIRMGNWKGIITDIRKGNTRMELYDLENDIQELHDVADKHPDIVEKFNQLMSDSSTPPENPKFAF